MCNRKLSATAASVRASSLRIAASVDRALRNGVTVLRTALVAALLGLSMGFLAAPTHASEPSFELRLVGDLDGDDEVTLRDASALAQVLQGRRSVPRFPGVADADGDEKIGPADLERITAWATGGDHSGECVFTAELELGGAPTAVSGRLGPETVSGDFFKSVDGLGYETECRPSGIIAILIGLLRSSGSGGDGAALVASFDGKGNGPIAEEVDFIVAVLSDVPSDAAQGVAACDLEPEEPLYYSVVGSSDTIASSILKDLIVSSFLEDLIVSSLFERLLVSSIEAGSSTRFIYMHIEGIDGSVVAAGSADQRP